jgi:hypothetical protein
MTGDNERDNISLYVSPPSGVKCAMLRETAAGAGGKQTSEVGKTSEVV